MPWLSPCGPQVVINDRHCRTGENPEPALSEGRGQPHAAWTAWISPARELRSERLAVQAHNIEATQKGPRMLEKFARYPLTFGPTPIEKLECLGQHLGGKVELYAKREDCNSGLAFGGNKLRKLEYIIPDAIASNADTLVSIGGVQSNHTRTSRRRSA
jgi:hypothetical protein